MYMRRETAMVLWFKLVISSTQWVPMVVLKSLIKPLPQGLASSVQRIKRNNDERRVRQRQDDQSIFRTASTKSPVATLVNDATNMFLPSVSDKKTPFDRRRNDPSKHSTLTEVDLSRIGDDVGIGDFRTLGRLNGFNVFGCHYDRFACSDKQRCFLEGFARSSTDQIMIPTETRRESACLFW